jgi:hypothetical protein
MMTRRAIGVLAAMCKVTGAAVLELKKALPGLKVDR